MSLKAKIEAVIYASEEPVTLAQLTGLLGEEGQAELDTLAAQQHSLALEDESALYSDTGSSDPEPSDPEPSDPEPVEEANALNEEALEPDAKALAAAAKLRERKLRDYFRSLLEELIADYANGDRGLEVREVAGGFRLATKPEYHDAVRGFVKSLKPPLKLTLQALETLAVVAYKQPVTAPEVSEIRGVDSAGVLGSLLTRKLVTTAGRKQVIGRPILYKTTKDFLLRFGLKDINELPSIEEFEKMAGELNETLLDQASETEAQEEVRMEAEASEPSPNDDLNDDLNDNLNDDPSSDPIELEGYNLQPAEPDAPTSEPESIPEPEPPTDPEA